MIARKQGDWLAAKAGDEILMMSAEKGLYLGLAGAGARIWDLLDTPRSVMALCGQLTQEFDVEPAACQGEVAAFLDELATHGAIAFEPQPDA